MAELKGKILAGKILVKPMEAEEKTQSGIIIPDSAKEKPQQGTVVLVGTDKKDEPMEVKVGDVVFMANTPEPSCILTEKTIC
jgi:chaperonin GroES